MAIFVVRIETSYGFAATGDLEIGNFLCWGNATLPITQTVCDAGFELLSSQISGLLQGGSEEGASEEGVSEEATFAAETSENGTLVSDPQTRKLRGA